MSFAHGRALFNVWRGSASPQDYLRIAKRFLAIGNILSADLYLQRAVDAYPENVLLRTKFAEAAMARGDWPEATRRCEALLEQLESDISPETTALLSRAYRHTGKVDEAEAMLYSAMATEPRNGLLLVELALCGNFRPRAEKIVDPNGLPQLDIVICIHNAWSAVSKCLESILYSTRPPFGLILVDDHSDPEVRANLDRFVLSQPWTQLLRNSENLGYTRAANRGLRAAQSDWVILLNSDTIVTRGWIEGLFECALSDSDIKAVGPLSNAATFQSIPYARSPDGRYANNELRAGISVEQMASLVRNLSARSFPLVPILNGFCTLFHKPSLDQVGYFDEVNFPRGYGEENDLCLRLVRAGHKLAIADHVFVYHLKSASFGHPDRVRLKAEGGSKMRCLWPGFSYGFAARLIGELPALKRLRSDLNDALVKRSGSW
jgi:GT2 family glycosyltransferase